MLKTTPHGILCDISGVLKDGSDDEDIAIDESVDAFKRLQSSGIPFVLCTNESCFSTTQMADKLTKIGFEITADKIISPVSCIQRLIKAQNLRPHVLANERVTYELESMFDTSNPNAVIVGDAEERFTYKSMNETFQLLVEGDRKFYSLGKSKFFKQSGKLILDVGCWVTGLEYSSQRTAEVVGKPSAAYFNEAAKMLGIEPCNLVMIGDDIESDIGGAMKAGCQAILVRTGKFRLQDESHPTVSPDFIADNFRHALEVILAS